MTNPKTAPWQAVFRTIDESGYTKDFPEDYFWAIGPQSPVLLHHLMHAIDRPLPSEPKRLATRTSKAQKAH
jgi:hypothetical protein